MQKVNRIDRFKIILGAKRTLKITLSVRSFVSQSVCMSILTHFILTQIKFLSVINIGLCTQVNENNGKYNLWF